MGCCGSRDVSPEEDQSKDVTKVEPFVLETITKVKVKQDSKEINTKSKSVMVNKKVRPSHESEEDENEESEEDEEEDQEDSSEEEEESSEEEQEVEEETTNNETKQTIEEINEDDTYDEYLMPFSAAEIKYHSTEIGSDVEFKEVSLEEEKSNIDLRVYPKFFQKSEDQKDTYFTKNDVLELKSKMRQDISIEDVKEDGINLNEHIIKFANFMITPL